MEIFFDILDDFTLRVRNVELELENSCECTESTVELVYTQFFMILVIIW